MYKKLISFCIAVCCCLPTLAQTDSTKVTYGKTAGGIDLDATFEKLMGMTLDDYMNLYIPPLPELFENAKKSPTVQQYRYEAESVKNELITARRAWMNYIRGFASYTYGNSDLAAISYVETTYPIWNYNTASNQQSFWNVGVTLNIPLQAIWDYNNRIKFQKNRAEALEKRSEAMLETTKRDIITFYTRILEQRTVLKVAAENVMAAKAMYDASEIDFVNNAISSHDLYQRKSYEMVATRTYEAVRASLNEAILSLEVISCTNILTGLGDPAQPDPTAEEEVKIDKTNIKKKK